jgi:hypothetical protein
MRFSKVKSNGNFLLLVLLLVLGSPLASRLLPRAEPQLAGAAASSS